VRRDLSRKAVLASDLVCSCRQLVLKFDVWKLNCGI
jgi:hypothetical protein